jgi:hypothetical protein
VRAWLKRLFQRFNANVYASGSVSVLLFAYTSVSRSAVSALYCVDVPGVSNVLFAAPTVDCDSSDYHSLQSLAVLMLIGYTIGVPLVGGALLWWARGGFASESAVPVQRTASQPDGIELDINGMESPASTLPTVVRRRAVVLWCCRPLSANLVPRGLYWQCLLLLVRAVMVLIDVFLQLDRAWQCSLYALLHLVCLLLHMLLSPFNTPLLNHVALGVHAMLVGVTQLLNADGTAPPLLGQSPTLIVTSVLVVGVSVSLVGLVGVLRWRHWKTKAPSPPRRIDTSDGDTARL